MAFTAIEPFGIDDGELDDLRAVGAFTLGVEWGMVYGQLRNLEEFHDDPIHTDNRRRIETLLRHQCYEQSWRHGDDWCYVTARPK